MTEPNDGPVVADEPSGDSQDSENSENSENSADSEECENAKAATEPIITAAPDGQPPTDDTDFEGPRRRARREREERRAVPARATAIEQARREAKRRVSGSIVNEPKPVARGVVRGLKMLLATVLLVIVGVGLALVLYFTPAMSARSIVVTGIGAVTREEVLDAAGVRIGTPLLQINTSQVADRVAAIGGWPARGCSASTRRRCASPSSSENRSW